MRHIILPKEYGQALVEFALVIPLLLVLVLGTFDLGYAVFTYNMLNNAAREGARAGAIIRNSDDVIRSRVRTTAPVLNLADGDIQISPSPKRTFEQPVIVTVQFMYQPLTPVVGNLSPGGFPLSSTSVMIVEGVYDATP